MDRSKFLLLIYYLLQKGRNWSIPSRGALGHELDASEDMSEAVEQENDWLLDFSEDDSDPLIELDAMEELTDIEEEADDDFPAAGITEVDVSGETQGGEDIVETASTDNEDSGEIKSSSDEPFDTTDIVSGPVSFSSLPSGFAISNAASAPVSTVVAAPPAGNTTSVDADLSGNLNINLYMQGFPHFTPFHYSTLDVNEISAFPIGRYPFFEPTQYFYPQTLVSVGEEAYEEFEYRFTTNPLTNPLYGQVPPLGALLGFEITPGAPLSITADFPVYGDVNGEYTIGSDWLVVSEPVSTFNVTEYQDPLTVGQIDQFYLDFGDRTTLFEKADPFVDSVDDALNKLIGK
ncbi:MAG: hypothetical protein GY750_08820 [Lentisphaerae bacterium]|nr:hypothetical protein [Lentisphaerota bacterium]MCP4101513.1 hypothetical protein [Lentisphaerota bacterium]